MLRRMVLPVAMVAVIAGCGGNRGRDSLPSPDPRVAEASDARTTGRASLSAAASDTPSAAAGRTSAPEAERTQAAAGGEESGTDKRGDRAGTIGNGAPTTMGSTPPTSSSPTTMAANDEPVARPDPARVQAPSVGIDVTLDLLSMTANKELEVPKDPDRVGWWRSTKRQSPIVLVGHVDSLTGPAVFFRVRDMKRGDDIVLTLSDGTTRAFVVTSTEQVSKNSFPTNSVYRSGTGELRLVTCGGRFNRQSRHYVDNVVVFARPM